MLHNQLHNITQVDSCARLTASYVLPSITLAVSGRLPSSVYELMSAPCPSTAVHCWMSQFEARLRQHADPTLLPRFPTMLLSQLYNQSNHCMARSSNVEHAGTSYGWCEIWSRRLHVTSPSSDKDEVTTSIESTIL